MKFSQTTRHSVAQALSLSGVSLLILLAFHRDKDQLGVPLAAVLIAAALPAWGVFWLLERAKS